jgi:hypothetical protein
VFDNLVGLPAWVLSLGICGLIVVLLLPFWWVLRPSDQARLLRAAIASQKAEKLLKSVEPISIQITERKTPSLLLRFADEKIHYRGRAVHWELPFVRVKSWRIFDSLNTGNSDFVNSGRNLWNVEFKDSSKTYSLDALFIEESESLDLVKAACACALGSNSQTRLEGLRLELTRSERLLHQVNSGNMSMKV